jgi:DNA-binding response OmpR family regulator
MAEHLLKGLKILVVEDDPDLLGILGEFLIMQGADVVQALNGKEALEILNSKSFDLVLSDVQMPVMDGVELIRAIKQKDKNSPVVFLTTGHSSLDEISAQDLGAAAFIVKPFKLQHLLSSICKSFSIAHR